MSVCLYVCVLRLSISESVRTVGIHCSRTINLTLTSQTSRISRSEEFHFGGSSGGEMSHFMQFSVATCELCTLGCMLLNCNGTKCTGNSLSIPAVACSQQLLRRNKLSTGCYFFLFWSFHPMI